MNNTKILDKAIEVYGVYNQVDMAIEEMSELTKALLKDRRNPDDGTLANIQEEIADVLIMLEQLQMIYSSHKITNIYTERKINRLKEQLERDGKHD